MQPPTAGERAGSATPDPARDDRPLVAARVANAVTLTVFLGFVSTGLTMAPGAGLRGGSGIVVGLACAAVVIGVQWRVLRRYEVGLPGSLATLVLQAVVGAVPLVVVGTEWVALPGFVAAHALLVLRGATAPIAVAATVAGVVVAEHVEGSTPLATVGAAVGTLLTAGVVYTLTHLAYLVRCVHQMRASQAERAGVAERERRTRELHTLLRHHTEEITLHGSLALRLLELRPADVPGEMTRVLAAARSAQSGTRVVAHTATPATWEQEVAKVRAALASRGMAVAVSTTGSPAGLEVSDRILVHAVLHAGAALALGGSGAAGYTVRLAVLPDRLVLDARVDGAAGPHGDTGLAGLAARAAAEGGTLEAAEDPDGTWRLHVDLPRAPGPPEAAGDDLAAAGPEPPPPRDTVAWRPRRGTMPAILAGFFLVAALSAASLPGDRGLWWATVACLLGVLAVTLVLLARGPSPTSLPMGALLVGQVALWLLPALWLPAWVGLSGLVAGCAMVYLRSLPRIVVVLALLATDLVLRLDTVPSTAGIVIGVVGTVNSGLATWALFRLRQSLDEERRASRDLADLAAARERFRFARNVHDLLGLDLAGLALKAELVLRLHGTDPARARTELLDLLDAAARLLAEAHALDGDGDTAGLREEIERVRSVLDLAGITLRVVEPPDGGVDRDVLVPGLLRAVLREGAANMLRHSQARRCTISVHGDGHRIRLEMANDGAPTAPTAPAGVDGTGLSGLRRRLEEAGGRMSAAGQRDGTFRLAVVVPAPLVALGPGQGADLVG